MFGNLIQNGTRLLGRSALQIQKYSPQILTVAGIAGGVTAAVMGAKATLKLEAVVDNHEREMEILSYELLAYADQKDITLAKVKYVGNIVKLYAPSVTLGVASVACILAAHGILHKRNVALAAAYKLVEGQFNDYRKRVVEEYGEELENYKGIREVEVKNEETGKVEKKKKFDPITGKSTYARFFDEGSKYWQKVPEMNLAWLRTQEAYFNQRLQAYGHVFLNEVYDALGIPRTKAGQVVGWVISEDGDNYIDFDIYNPDNANFVNGANVGILLDFNVDGVIYDKI